MVTMSQKEFQRVKVIENAAGERLSVREASRLLQLSERQVQRLKRRYRPDSMSWVQHGNRGRAMLWAISTGGKICSEIQAAAPGLSSVSGSNE
jgi:Homeodomain-like domain